MKKIVLTICIVTISISPLVFAENYTGELQSAYDYAYSVGITTQSSIDAANMYGSLIRAHMAKMMVSYAKEVLGQEPDTSKTCTFTDIADQSSELQGYITQACQMGLMGVGITAFKPNDQVTRAQFGTVLSRALYGDTYNDGDPYYSNHLKALREAGIMTKIDTPSMNEIRWYVMLMMMRAGEIPAETTSSICDTSENQLACLVGSVNCPAECQSIDDITTFAGTLHISSTNNSVGQLPTNVKYAGSLQLTTTDQDINIKNITFQKIGNFTNGRIEDDGVKIVIMQSLANDATITISFSPKLIIKQGEAKTLDIFIEDDNGQQQWLTLSNTKNIQSSASTIEGNFPVRVVE